MKESVSSLAIVRPQLRSGQHAITKGTFRSSIQDVLAIATQETGALGYALYVYEQHMEAASPESARETPPRVKMVISRSAEGAADIGQSGSQGEITIPLRDSTGVVGLLDFWFPSIDSVSEAQRDAIGRVAETVTSVLAYAHLQSDVTTLTARVAELESYLADLKISERAAGLKEANGLERRTEILRDHVSSVLSKPGLLDYLAERARELEERIHERAVIGDAKVALQRQYQLSEEEAYLQLRNASRRSRKRLFAVATEVLIEEGQATVPRLSRRASASS